MQREEKQLEAALDAIIQRVSDLKGSITGVLMKLEHEHETLNWPAFLDKFGLVSGQFNTLLKLLRNEKTPPLRNSVLLPLLLNPDRDEELVKVTDNRISCFSHDLVPDYLRTKPDPEVEQRHQQLEQKANQSNADAVQKQINTLNKIVNGVLDTVNSAREEWESEAGARANASQTSSVADTHTLIAAASLGKGLKTMAPRPGPPPPAATPTPQQASSQMSQAIKAPSAIKTNIKAAAQVHPYNR